MAHLLVGVVAVEFLLGVRDLEATVEGTLHRGENLGAKSGALEADIEVGVEGGDALLLILVVEHVAVLELSSDLLGTLEFVGETVLGQQTTSAERQS